MLLSYYAVFLFCFLLFFLPIAVSKIFMNFFLTEGAMKCLHYSLLAYFSVLPFLRKKK